MERVLLLGAAMVASACTDPLQPGSGDDVGSGTRTLRVEGRVLGSSDSASFVVQIWRGSLPVTDVDVSITSRTGRYVLRSDPRFPGKWSGLPAESYDEVYVLDVESGDDEIRNVRVDGPPLVVFTSPAASSTIDPASPLEVRWKPGMADQLFLRVNPQGTVWGEVDDVGSFTIPADTVVPSLAGSHAIGLSRTNKVTPAGAAEGSWMSVSTEEYLEICDRPLTGICMD
jgi:hypothetical protein